MAVITWDQIQSVLDDLVAEKGADFVYEPLSIPGSNPRSICTYLHGQEPGCLVGHVLLRLGVDREWLAGEEGSSGGDVVTYSDLEIEDLTRVAKFLSQVQGYQDDSIPWGQAVQMAREVDRANRS